MSNNQHIILHLSLLNDVGPAVINRILETIALDRLSDLYAFTATDFIDQCNVTIKMSQDLVAGLADKKLLERECALIEKEKVQVLTLLDNAYPSLLRNIHLPPAVLYYKGRALQEDVPTLAFVGSRAATSYGKKIVDTLIPPLVEQGWHIVSGGALGIDTFAHQAAVQAGGQTTVVFGSGLMHLYPWQNAALFSTILDRGGTLLTSFSMATSPLPGHFPARNRIIAGLSKACVVVQAAQKSGSLITASLALDQGREVFAVPGMFDDQMSAGCHALIKQGAQIVTSAQDILQEFGHISQQTIEQNLNIGATQTTITVAHELPTAPENPLVALCKQPISIDELEQKTGLSLLALQTALFDLQLEGKVTQNFMGMWQQRL